MSLMTRLFILATFIVAMTLSVSTLYAQDNRDKSRVIHRSTVITQPVETENGVYYPTKLADIANLFWKYDVHKVEDLIAVNQYIQMKDCVVHSDYFANDFLWQRIQQSQIMEINYFKDQFNTRFVVSDVIRMGRFDFQESNFYIDSRSMFRNMGHVTLFDRTTFQLDCPLYKYDRNMNKFPLYIGFKLDEPLTFQSFPIKRSIAKGLIERLSRKRNEDRVFFSRVYLNAIGLYEAKVDAGYNSLVQFLARVERIEIYEDIENKNLLYAKDF